MPRGLLTGADAAVAAWAWKTFGFRPMPVDRALGIVDRGNVVGALVFQNFNGSNVDFSYYGPHTATLGIMRNAALYALSEFNPTRVTVMTAKTNKSIVRFLSRVGAKFEGVMHGYYGPAGPASKAVRFMLDRSLIEKLACPRRAAS